MVDLNELIERMEKRYYEQFRKTGDFSINGVDYYIADIEKLSYEQRLALYEAVKRGCEEFWGK